MHTFTEGLNKLADSVQRLGQEASRSTAALVAFKDSWDRYVAARLAQMTPEQREMYHRLVRDGAYQLEALIAAGNWKAPAPPSPFPPNREHWEA